MPRLMVLCIRGILLNVESKRAERSETRKRSINFCFFKVTPTSLRSSLLNHDHKNYSFRALILRHSFSSPHCSKTLATKFVANLLVLDFIGDKNLCVKILLIA